eukprot:462270_1
MVVFFVKCTAIVTVCLIIHKLYSIIHRKLNNYPPGLNSIEIIPYLSNITSIAAKTNDLYSTPISLSYFFGIPLVGISDHKLLQTICKQHLQTAPIPVDTTDLDFNQLQGKSWLDRRKFNHECLKHVINSTYVETVVNNLLTKSVFPMMDAKINTNKNVYKCRLDIQWIPFAFMFGILFGIKQIPSYDCIEFKQFISNMETSMAGIAISRLIKCIPIENKTITQYLLNLFPFENAGNAVHLQVTTWLNTCFEKNNQNTYCYWMMKKVNQKLLTKHQVTRDLQALFLAGTHTTSATLEVILYSLCKYPNIQQRVYQELKDFYDNNGAITLKDTLSKLPILKAFIFECMRLHPVVPITFPRYVSKGCKIDGYNIPKNSRIVGCTKHIQRNGLYWKYPNTFYIEHFLDKNGRFERNLAFCMFGKGRRDCFGQNLAVNSMYLIISSLLLRYKLEIPQKHYKMNSEFKIPNIGTHENAHCSSNQLFIKIVKR